MSLIQKEIADFTVQCYQNNAFRAVSKADVLQVERILLLSRRLYLRLPHGAGGSGQPV